MAEVLNTIQVIVHARDTPRATIDDDGENRDVVLYPIGWGELALHIPADHAEAWLDEVALAIRTAS